MLFFIEEQNFVYQCIAWEILIYWCFDRKGPRDFVVPTTFTLHLPSKKIGRHKILIFTKLKSFE